MNKYYFPTHLFGYSDVHVEVLPGVGAAEGGEAPAEDLPPSLRDGDRQVRALPAPAGRPHGRGQRQVHQVHPHLAGRGLRLHGHLAGGGGVGEAGGALERSILSEI